MTDPASAEELANQFLTNRDLVQTLANEREIHVLIAQYDGPGENGQIEAVLGPFPDLWSASAYALTWSAALNFEERTTKVTVHRLYPAPA